jgi:hypothetical protein
MHGCAKLKVKIWPLYFGTKQHLTAIHTAYIQTRKTCQCYTSTFLVDAISYRTDFDRNTT